MFYTKSFLAQKGPLSTVWMAAHLQHRLKKSHYTTTDIPSIVLRIMDPGVPIALRMSGHLLLGVVRIYSKKVEYLHQDCKDALTGLHKAFTTLQYTQPEEARPAQFQSVTLPGTFDLDAQNIDDKIDHGGADDLHTRNPEDITLTDRIPVTTDYYVTVSFDEDIMDSLSTEVLPDSGGIVPMEEDIIPQSPLSNVVGVEDHGPSTQRVSPTIQHTGGLSPSVHSPTQATQVEAAVFHHDSNNDDNIGNPLGFSDLDDNNSEPNRILDETANERNHGPEMNSDLDPEGISVSSQEYFNPPTPPTSQGGTSDVQAHGENNSPNFELGESPPIQQPQRRGRRRKQVLTNEFIRSTLKNTHIKRIKRKRRNVAVTPPPTVPTNQNPEESIAATNQTSGELAATSPVTAFDMEIELIHNVAVTPPPTVPAHNVVEDDYRSPDRRDDLTMASPHNVSVASERMHTLDLAASPGAHGSENVQTLDLGASPGAHRSETMQTPDSDTHHLIDSTEIDELGFLTMDNNTPASSQGTSGSAKLSKRTWHAAEYVKRLSLISLNNILEGKTRHIAARMFFEVLVLKTNELVHVQQEQPYGDISLKLAPTLSNAQS